MYPILYNGNETNFAHNGIGLLRDAITVYPEEELNGLSEITIEYDADGFLAEQIANGMIIKAKANDKQQPQLFRIYSHVKDHATDRIIINGQHITYDLADNFVEKLILNDMTTRQAMEAIQYNLAYPTRFNITSTNNTTTSSTRLYRTNPLQMIAGMEGSILQHWGGQIERDNFNLIMHRRRGSDDGVHVLYKKNLTGLQATFDDGKVVTRIFPFKYVEATEEEPERLITVPGKYIDSPNIDKYDHIKILPIDASNEEGIDNSDDLYNAYKDYFSNEGKGKDLPSVSMEVEFEPLWETEEYKDVAALELVGLGDTVTIGHSKFGLDLKATVVKIEYDSIAEKNRKVSLGNVKAGLTDNINKNEADINNKINEVNQKVDGAIRASNGKNTIYYGPDEPTGDHLIKGDMWFRIVDGEYTRTYIYDGVQWQVSIDMESKEAKETANEARNRAEEANDKANLATSNANDAIAQAQEAFDNAENLTKVVDQNTEDITSVSVIAQGLQTRVSDAEGNITSVTQLASAMQTKLTNAEGDIHTLTQTASSLQNTISGLEESISSWTSHYSVNTVNFKNLTEQDGSPLDDNYTYEVTGKTMNTNTVTTAVAIFKAKDSSSTGGNGWDLEIVYESGGKNSNRPEFFLDSNGKPSIRLYNHTSLYTVVVTHQKSIGSQSQITQLNNAINLRVQKGDVINQINISTEDILISGKKLILDSNTTVNGSFKVSDANITALNAGKITAGTLDAGKVSLINLRGLDIYGSRFSSSNGNNWMEIIGGDMRFSQYNGSYVNISPVGMYGYNASGELRFQSDLSLTTSAAFGTVNTNVYLGSFSETRSVTFNSIGGDGAVDSYTYTDVRAKHFYGNVLEANWGVNNATNVYLRPRAGGEIRVTAGQTTDTYLDLRARGLYTTYLDKNLNHGSGDSIYVRPASNGELRVTRIGTTNRYLDVRAYGLKINAIDFNTDASTGSNLYVRTVAGGELRFTTNGGTSVYVDVRSRYAYTNVVEINALHGNTPNLFLRPGGTGEVRVTAAGRTDAYRPIRAASFPEGSSEKIKENILKFEGNALDILRKSVIYEYNRIGLNCKRELGFIIERETPDKVKYDGESINGYSHRSLNTKAIQELDLKVDNEISRLREVIETQVFKIAELEEQINKLEVTS